MHVVFRVDSDEFVGIGHYMRCLSFAQVLRDEEIQVDFITSTKVEFLLKKLEDENIRIIPFDGGNLQEDISWALNYLESLNKVDLFILDGYPFNTDYHYAVKHTGIKLLCIDDLAKIHFACDYVLNQNLGSKDLDYSLEPYTKLLLGPRYWLWRREFRNVRPCDTQSLFNKTISKIIVTLGGGDITSQLIKILSHLENIKLSHQLHIKVITGHSDKVLLTKMANNLSCKVELIPFINNMSEAIQWADLAIAGAGTTLYEVLYLGIPVLICVLSDNQITSGYKAIQLQMGLFLDINRGDKFREIFTLALENSSIRQSLVINQQKHFRKVGMSMDVFHDIIN